MTIDLGFAYMQLPSGRRVGIVDVPGHRRFLKNMLAGVHGMDAVLLVIAADEGPMPQTREHLAIIDLLGIEHGVVVLTKSDLVDEAWLGVRTRGLQQHNRPVEEARPGSRTAVNLSGLDHSEVRRGDVLALPGTLPASRRLDARLIVLPGVQPLRHHQVLQMYHETSE